MENKYEIEEITKMKQAALLLDNQDKIKAYEEIIEKINILIQRTNVVEIKEGFELDIVSLLRENKDIRKKIKDDYLEEKNQDSELYKQNNKELIVGDDVIEAVADEAVILNMGARALGTIISSIRVQILDDLINNTNISEVYITIDYVKKYKDGFTRSVV